MADHSAVLMVGQKVGQWVSLMAGHWVGPRAAQTVDCSAAPTAEHWVEQTVALMADHLAVLRALRMVG